MKVSNITVNVSLPWVILWLFTIAFCHLGFSQGAIALLIWPYYLGEAVASAVGR